MRVLPYLGVLAACAHVRPHPRVKPTDDDLTFYRDVALVRQRVELDGANATISVPEGVTADDVLVIDGHAKLKTGGVGLLNAIFPDGGHHSLVLGYITDKLPWEATYTMTANAAHDRATLRGSLAIRNMGGVTLHGTARVIDADLGAWQTRRATQVKSALDAVTAPDDGAPIARDLGTVVVVPGETRVALVSGRPRGMRNVLVYDPIGTGLDNAGSVPVRDPALGVDVAPSPKLSESFEIARDAHETAGLPAGPVRLVERTLDGPLLGQGRLFEPQTRRSTVDTIATGTAEGVTGKRGRRELTDEESRHRLVEEFVIELDNARPRPVDVLVREHLYRGQTWALAYWSVEDIHQDGAQAIDMRTSVPAHGQVKILYVVVYTWGT